MKILGLDRTGLLEKSEYVNSILKNQPAAKKKETKAPENQATTKKKETKEKSEQEETAGLANPLQRDMEKNEPRKRDLETSSISFNTPTIPVDMHCHVCGSSENLKLCSRCKSVCYCSPTCQKKDWSKHKAGCKTT
jgi:hypothetical protein